MHWKKEMFLLAVFLVACGVVFSGCKWIIGLEKEKAGARDAGEDVDDMADPEFDTLDGEECGSSQGCDDGELCNGQESCTEGGCVPGSPLPDGHACTVNVVVFGECQDQLCVPMTCGNAIVEKGEECDDGNSVQDDGCNSICRFSCTFNSECDNGNECTTDLCVVEGNVKKCQSLNNHETCDDVDSCTREDRCEAGSCGGIALICGDPNPCTSDSCDPDSGCVHEFNEDRCDDGNPCTSPDTCLDGECVPGESTCDCGADPEVCTAQDDDNPCNGTLVCEDGACLLELLEPGCDTSGPCRKNHCLPDAEAPEGYRCEVQDEPDGAPCDDGDRCTLVDSCQAGECVGTGDLDCDDSNPCTTDGCDPLEGCYHENNANECFDGLFCTVRDRCNGSGDCVGEPRLVRDDNECTADFCDEINDKPFFFNLPEYTPCQDEGHWCIEGICVPIESE